MNVAEEIYFEQNNQFNIIRNALQRFEVIIHLRIYVDVVLLMFFLY